MRKRALVFAFLFVFPASGNYSLKSFSVGGGGSEGSASNNYSAEMVIGEIGGSELDGGTYKSWPGLIYTQMANTPGAPTFSNAANYYNKLNLIIDEQNNPSDAQFAIAISTDDFVTTNYVQSDNTVGNTLGSEDWQTYTDWGGGSGEFVVGLTPATTYKVKVKARHGNYTEGPWGPEASASTSGLTLSFDIDVSSSDSETGAPYTVSMGNLNPGNIVTATDKIWVDLSTNANSGGAVYLYGSTTGLFSSTVSYTIAGYSGNLSSVNEGFGLRSNSATQSSGGPLSAVSPYNGSNEVVGTIATTPQTVYSSTAPLVDGRGSLLVKAKINALTPAATDYSDSLVLIAAGIF